MILHGHLLQSVNLLFFSRSLHGVNAPNAVVCANLKEDVLRLKKEAGKSILVGSVSVPSPLTDMNLVDEFHFIVHPVMIGEG
jgi:dihydrofolate reductase